MGQSPSEEANTSSATQEIPRILLNSKVHYRTQQEPAICPSCEPDQFSPSPIPHLEDTF